MASFLDLVPKLSSLNRATVTFGAVCFVSALSEERTLAKNE